MESFKPSILVNGQNFPDFSQSVPPRDGIAAIGGKLDPSTLVQAYRNGIFPFYEEDPPGYLVQWFFPKERAVFFPDAMHITRSLKKTLRKSRFVITTDKDFSGTISGCADRESTWITPYMKSSFEEMHKKGYAHSFEVWSSDENSRKLVGGLYGLYLGNAFFGESMFSLESDASKMALLALANFCRKVGVGFIDCQLSNPYLESMGAVKIPAKTFLKMLANSGQGADFKGKLTENFRPSELIQ